MIEKKKFVKDSMWIAFSAISLTATFYITPRFMDAFVFLLAGTLLVYCGAELNMATMWYNKGKMPVIIKADCLGHLDDAQIAREETEAHFLVRNTDNVKFKFFIDRINFGCITYSLGDLIMNIGVAIAVASGIWGIYRILVL